MSEEHKPNDRRLMVLRGRIGAHQLHATHDPRKTTEAARRAFLQGFEQAVDPDGLLPPEERARRAGQLRKAHFARMAYRSAIARRAQRPSGARQGKVKESIDVDD